MEVVKQAYRFTFNWCTGPNNYTLVHGETRGKAKMQFLRDCDCEDDELLNIRGKRDKPFDLVLQPPNEDAVLLTKEQISKMSHAIGHDYYKAVPYRNYYQVREDADFEHLITLGLVAKDESMGLHYYYLTPRGINAIKSLQPCYRLSLNGANATEGE